MTTPAAVVKTWLLASPRVTDLTREVYVMVGSRDSRSFITVACQETPQTSIAAIGGASLTLQVVAWSADYDEAHELADAARGALHGISLDAEDHSISLDGIRLVTGPRDTFAEVKSGDIYFAIELTFNAEIRRA